MANILEVKGYTSEQIKALMNVEDKYKIGMRLYAVYQVSKGENWKSFIKQVLSRSPTGFIALRRMVLMVCEINREEGEKAD